MFKIRIVSLSRIRTYVPLGFIGRYLSKLIILVVAFASCSMLICRSFLQSHSFRRRSDGIVPMFCTVHGRFHCTVAALKIGLELARGSCDIFPTQRLAFGDIVLPQRLVLARGPMISSSSLFFVLRVSSDDRSFNINFLSLLEVFRSTFSSSFILT